MDQRGFVSGQIPGAETYGKSQRPKIFIRTIDTRAGTMAGRANLAADNVELGDIFSTDADAIVSASNGVGHMNGGVDRAIRDRFADYHLEGRVRQTIVEHFKGHMQIGEAFAIRTRPPGIPLRTGDPEWLIVAPTMTQPRAMGERDLRDAAYRSTLAALMAARTTGVRAVVLPTMGAGVGAGAHTSRGASAGKIAAAIRGLDQALMDFQDIIDGSVSYKAALAEYAIKLRADDRE
jgi:O-acetyl-ADP-ribose deacetylase (regulator of RNase III)